METLTLILHQSKATKNKVVYGTEDGSIIQSVYIDKEAVGDPPPAARHIGTVNPQSRHIGTVNLIRSQHRLPSYRHTLGTAQ